MITIGFLRTRCKLLDFLVSIVATDEKKIELSAVSACLSPCTEVCAKVECNGIIGNLPTRFRRLRLILSLRGRAIVGSSTSQTHLWVPPSLLLTEGAERPFMKQDSRCLFLNQGDWNTYVIMSCDLRGRAIQMKIPPYDLWRLECSENVWRRFFLTLETEFQTTTYLPLGLNRTRDPRAINWLRMLQCGVEARGCCVL